MRRAPDSGREPRGGSARSAALLLAVLGLAATAAPAQEPPALRVFAAASLTEWVEELAGGYAAATVLPSFGASSVLARQIRDGAPADVFLSASPEWMDFLRDAGALAGEPVALARGRLVAVASRDGSLAARRPGDPRALLGALGAGARVGIADEGVPAGDYARAALERLGLLEALRSRLVGQRDVRAVLHAVERGELDAGFVYATDARLAAVETLFAFEAGTHPPIEYAAAVVRGTARAEEARRFLAHLRSREVRGRLLRAGFALP